MWRCSTRGARATAAPPGSSIWTAKASLGSLHALADYRLLEYLAAEKVDRLFLRDYHVPWFDQVYPKWRRQFTRVDSAGRAAIFARDGTGAETGPDR